MFRVLITPKRVSASHNVSVSSVLSSFPPTAPCIMRSTIITTQPSFPLLFGSCRRERTKRRMWCRDSNNDEVVWHRMRRRRRKRTVMREEEADKPSSYLLPLTSEATQWWDRSAGEHAGEKEEGTTTLPPSQNKGVLFNGSSMLLH